MNGYGWAALCAAGVMGCGQARANLVTFDFEEFDPLQVYAPVATYGDGFATLSGVDGRLMTYSPAANGSNSAWAVINDHVPTAGLRIDFAGSVDAVAADIGSFGAPGDLEVFIQEFDAGGQFLGQDATIFPQGYSGTETVTLSDPGTAYAIFGAVFTSGGASSHTAVTYDNIRYHVQAAGPVGSYIPEPASWVLMIAGFGLAGASLRERRPRTA